MVVVLLAVTGRKRKEQVRKTETSQKSPATSHVSLARQVRPMAFPILKENLRKQSFFFFSLYNEESVWADIHYTRPLVTVPQSPKKRVTFTVEKETSGTQEGTSRVYMVGHWYIVQCVGVLVAHGAEILMGGWWDVRRLGESI